MGINISSASAERHKLQLGDQELHPGTRHAFVYQRISTSTWHQITLKMKCALCCRDMITNYLLHFQRDDFSFHLLWALATLSTSRNTRNSKDSPLSSRPSESMLIHFHKAITSNFLWDYLNLLRASKILYSVRTLQTFSNILQVIVKTIRTFNENLHCGHAIEDILKNNLLCF